MKVRSFFIKKKNRKYFAAIVHGYDCNILIDDYSKNLKPGWHDLLAEDITYDERAIFRVVENKNKQQIDGDTVTFSMERYNNIAAGLADGMEGLWNPDTKVWTFPACRAKAVRQMDADFNSDLVTIEATFRERVSRCEDSVRLYGYIIAIASGYDSGASLGDGVCLVSGEIGSSRSAAGWVTVVEAGTIIRMQVPRSFLKDKLLMRVDVKVI